MYNTFIHKLANSNDGDVLITVDNMTVPVKLRRVDISHSTATTATTATTAAEAANEAKTATKIAAEAANEAATSDGYQVDIACSVMFEKRGILYDVASMYPKTMIPYNTPNKAAFREAVEKRVKEKCSYDFRIENVIFNDPATIVFWKDGTKTVVKCQEGDTFDPEKGLAMAICKKMLGNKGNFNEVFKKWMPEVGEIPPIKEWETELFK